MTMGALSLFGLFAVTAMLVAYALEDRSHRFILAFVGACTLGSIYGSLQPGRSGWLRRSGRSSRSAAGSAWERSGIAEILRSAPSRTAKPSRGECPLNGAAGLFCIVERKADDGAFPGTAD